MSSSRRSWMPARDVLTEDCRTLVEEVRSLSYPPVSRVIHIVTRSLLGIHLGRRQAVYAQDSVLVSVAGLGARAVCPPCGFSPLEHA